MERKFFWLNTERIFVIALVVMTADCANHGPSTPLVYGPQRARPNDTIYFSALSFDPDGDSIAYFFASSDGTDRWSDWFPSGFEYSQELVFTDTGDYYLRAKAKDRYQESGWSDTCYISVRFYQPLPPHRPTGPDTVTVGDTVSFYSAALHPLNEMVTLQFDWGDTLGSWSGFVLPGSLVRATHIYHQSGFYEVRCRAKDKKDFVSDWSWPETVLVIDGRRH